MSGAAPLTKRHLAVFTALLTITAFACIATGQTPKSSPPSPKPFAYNYTDEAKAAAAMDLDHPAPAGMRSLYTARRKRVLDSMPEGAMLLFSVDENQPRRYLLSDVLSTSASHTSLS
jgi:hypothetical protein